MLEKTNEEIIDSKKIVEVRCKGQGKPCGKLLAQYRKGTRMNIGLRLFCPKCKKITVT